MTSVAAGLALEGHVVYTYSIGNFPVMRCLEQIRNCVCYHNANVKIIAVGGGFVYGQLGMSHHATEDIPITRALPNMHVFCPADPDEAVKVIGVAHGIDGPCYIRLARGGEPALHPAVIDFDVTRLMPMQDGRDVAVIATGPVLSEALEAARLLDNGGVKIGVYNCISLKPFDNEGLRAIAERYGAIVSLEEHNVTGGLGSVVADALLSVRPQRMPRLVKLGLQDVYTSVVGSQSYLRKHYELSADDVVRVVKGMLT
jgi:transketolase